MKWNSDLYNEQHDFVTNYGKSLFDFVPTRPEQSVLDIGCGTGVLTNELSKKMRLVKGIDASKEMIAKAQQLFPTINFEVMDALELRDINQWDVIFSNAAFHWIDDHDLLLNTIHSSLKPSGKLICEFGAEGNIQTIMDAFNFSMKKLGKNNVATFNFPSVDVFSFLLEKNNFKIDAITAYDRPTALKNGKYGLQNWLQQFLATPLQAMPQELQHQLVADVENQTKATLWHNDQWVADYKRLRVIAHI